MASYNKVFTPEFFDDLDESLEYIGNDLENDIAANELLVKVMMSINARAEDGDFRIPTPYYMANDVKLYRLKVGNYFVIYEVVDNTMIMLRFLFGSRNIKSMLSGLIMSRNR